MTMPSQQELRIPMAGLDLTFSPPTKMIFTNGGVHGIFKLPSVHEEESPIQEHLGEHVATEALSSAIGVPSGLLEALFEGGEVASAENGQHTTGVGISNQVASLGGLVINAKDALMADGGTAGKIIDRNADKRAAESEERDAKRKRDSKLKRQ